jgi:hypothetical protein
LFRIVMIFSLLAGAAISAVPASASPCLTPDESRGALIDRASADARAADYDGDGDLDLAVLGADAGVYLVDVYRNDAGHLVHAGTLPVDVGITEFSWVDFDGDEDLDLSLTGAGSSPSDPALLKVYFNDPDGFRYADPGLAYPYSGRAVWADYDLDADQDVLITGFFGRVLRRDGASFALARDFQGYMTVDAATWVDVDGDADLDLVLAGTRSGQQVVVVLHNDLGAFDRAATVDTGLDAHALAGGDFDNDGDADLAAFGQDQAHGAVLRVYENVSGDLGNVLSTLSMPAASRTRLIWLDVDGDGRQDVVGSHRDSETATAWILLNLSTGASLSSLGTGTSEGILEPLDLELDGVHEFVLGSAGSGTPSTGLWANACSQTNTPPQPPTGLDQRRVDSTLTLSWDPAVDVETPPGGLRYWIRVGTTPGSADVASHAVSGSTERVVLTRSVGPLDYYHWSVRSIDAGGLMSGGADLGDCFAMQTWGWNETSHGTAWADFDGDGDWDHAHALSNAVHIEKNVGGAFERLTVAGDSVRDDGAFDWADYDGDGDLDLAADWGNAMEVSSRGAVFRNDQGDFVDAGFALPALNAGIPRWGDVDNDGDLDLLVAGTRVPRPGLIWPQVSLLRNAGAGLGPPELVAGGRDAGWIPALRFDDASLFDFDLDGDLDLLLLWSRPTQGPAGEPFSILLRNDGGVFTSIDNPLGLGNANFPTLDWGDTDADGHPELIVASDHSSLVEGGRGLFRVVNGAFEYAGGPEGRGIARFGDWNSDGFPELVTDLAFSFFDQVPGSLKVYDLQTPSPTDLMVLPPDQETAWEGTFLDMNGDDRLDLVVGGFGSSTPGYHKAVIQNLCSDPNTPPGSPTGLQVLRNGDQVTLSWEPGVDAETAVSGLSYNLMIGARVGGTEIMPPHSDPQTGRRLLAEPGNAGWRTSWTLTIPSNTSFYWGVQSIDAGFLASPFAVMSSEGVPTATGPPRRHARPGIRSVRPNPFNPITAIEYAVDRDQRLRIEVFDTRGCRVAVLLDQRVAAGEGVVEWDGLDARGLPVVGGVYFVRLTGPLLEDVRKVALVK